MDVQQRNAMARQAVLANSVNMWQPISTQSFASPLGEVINIPLRNVGLIKKLVVEVSFSIAQASAETLSLTPWGVSNFFSNVTFTDLSNQNRINTTGWHLFALATLRRQRAYGAAFTNDSPVDMGDNYSVMDAPAAVTTIQNVRFFMEIPLAYGDFDLRGSIFANVVNATQQLQLTVNPNFVVANTGNNVLAGYQSDDSNLGTVSACTITVHQNYLDQLPQTENGPVLPLLDLSTAYLLNNTVVTGLAAGQDNPIPYANFRNFMSTIAIFDNEALNAGTDVNTWKLESANYTNILKYGPFMSSLMTRNLVMDDYPAGTYVFDHRVKPISTVQYGNMQLILEPSTVAGSDSRVLVGYEALAMINQITQAGSLYGT